MIDDFESWSIHGCDFEEVTELNVWLLWRQIFFADVDCISCFYDANPKINARTMDEGRQTTSDIFQNALTNIILSTSYTQQILFATQVI